MSFAKRAVKEIVDDMYRDTPVEVDLSETVYYVSVLAPHAQERLADFLQDLAMRAPFVNPTWQPHQNVIAALANDIRRALAAEEAQ